MEGDPREILVSPAADPYQSDEAACLTRKALLILEQYHLRSSSSDAVRHEDVVDFDILANRWKYATLIYFQSEKLREEWEPGAASVAERIQAVREAHAAGIYTWIKLHPVAYPAELIGVVESLRADVDAWKIGKPPPGEPPPKVIVAGDPGFVDADTALAYLRRMVDKGLSDKLVRTDEMKIWSPDKRIRGKVASRERKLREDRVLRAVRVQGGRLHLLSPIAAGCRESTKKPLDRRPASRFA